MEGSEVMAVLFAILLLIEIILLATTVILYMCSKDTIGGIVAMLMLANLVLLFFISSFVGLENVLSSCECGCENCIGEMVGRR